MKTFAVTTKRFWWFHKLFKTKKYLAAMVVESLMNRKTKEDQEKLQTFMKLIMCELAKETNMAEKEISRQQIH